MGEGMGQHSLDTVNVLVIDDDEIGRLAVKTILSALGVAGVAEASDGARGIETLGRFPADIVICDWNMKPMSGIEFLRQVRGAEGVPNPDVPVIMLTGDPDMDRVIEARDNSATSFLGSKARRAMSEGALRIEIDRERRMATGTWESIETRAKFFDDQGCVILPEGSEDVFFTPRTVTSSLPPADFAPLAHGRSTPRILPICRYRHSESRTSRRDGVFGSR